MWFLVRVMSAAMFLQWVRWNFEAEVGIGYVVVIKVQIMFLVPLMGYCICV